jgi:hypothetical protein
MFSSSPFTGHAVCGCVETIMICEVDNKACLRVYWVYDGNPSNTVSYKR